MTNESTTVVLGIPIPSTDPLFLAIVGVHVPRSRDRWCHCDAEQQRTWSALELGDDLFLVPIRRIRHYERLVLHALGRELSLVHSGGAVIRVCAFRTHCCSAALAPMAQAASHWHGRVLYFAANRVLRGQRQEPT